MASATAPRIRASLLNRFCRFLSGLSLSALGASFWSARTGGCWIRDAAAAKKAIAARIGSMTLPAAVKPPWRTSAAAAGLPTIPAPKGARKVRSIPSPSERRARGPLMEITAALATAWIAAANSGLCATCPFSSASRSLRGVGSSVLSS